MGWSAGSEVMDAAIDGAMALMAAYRPAALVKSEASMDDILRPFVKRIADALNEQDWDTWSESKYFDRFAQEMLGHEDDEHLEWLEEEASYLGAGEDAQRELAEFRERMAAKHGLDWLEDR